MGGGGVGLGWGLFAGRQKRTAKGFEEIVTILEIRTSIVFGLRQQTMALGNLLRINAFQEQPIQLRQRNASQLLIDQKLGFGWKGNARESVLFKDGSGSNKAVEVLGEGFPRFRGGRLSRQFELRRFR